MWSGEAEILVKTVISNDREVNRNGRTIIFGTVENNSEDSM
jgi:hypothetical protein